LPDAVCAPDDEAPCTDAKVGYRRH